MTSELLRPAGSAAFKDRFTTRANELLQNYEEGDQSTFGLIGFPLSKSSISHSGAAFAPSVIRDCLAGFTTYSVETKKELTEKIIDFGDCLMHPTDISESQRRITEALEEVLATEACENWFILGGDHSISYSTIKAFSKRRKIGVLQFDAHHDLRNTEDGGPTNGTPFRRLIDNGILQGRAITQIGIRDFMNAKSYHQFAKQHGVRVYSMMQVRTMGIEGIVERELEYLAKFVDEIYLSVDMDVLDQTFAPGCPAIGPGGMDSYTLLRAIEIAARHPLVKMMDIVEIDPTKDFRDMTSKTAAYLLLYFIKNKK